MAVSPEASTPAGNEFFAAIQRMYGFQQERFEKLRNQRPRSKNMIAAVTTVIDNTLHPLLGYTDPVVGYFQAVGPQASADLFAEVSIAIDSVHGLLPFLLGADEGGAARLPTSITKRLKREVAQRQGDAHRRLAEVGPNMLAYRVEKRNRAGGYDTASSVRRAELDEASRRQLTMIFNALFSDPYSTARVLRSIDDSIGEPLELELVAEVARDHHVFTSVLGSPGREVFLAAVFPNRVDAEGNPIDFPSMHAADVAVAREAAAPGFGRD